MTKAAQDAEKKAKAEAKAEAKAKVLLDEDRFVGECDKCSFRILDSHVEDESAIKISAGRVRCKDADTCREVAEERDALLLSSTVRSTRQKE